jgi:biotin carboxyl carrier protein
VLRALGYTVSKNLALHWTAYAKIGPHRRLSGRLKTIGEQPVSDDNKSETTETPANKDAAVDPAPEQPEQSSTQSGPTFTKGPDPLAGVKKGAADVMASMEGKTVSMKVYVGTIVGIIVLMLLARCGG